MLPLDVNHRWMFFVEVWILFYGVFLENHRCNSSDTSETCGLKNVLFVSAKQMQSEFLFPSHVVYQKAEGQKLCFNIQRNQTHTGCCNSSDFSCDFEMKYQTGNKYRLIVDRDILSKQDIVVIKVPDDHFSCMPSDFYWKEADLLLSTHNCLDKGMKNIRLSQDGLCGKTSQYDEKACKAADVKRSDYIFSSSDEEKCVSCQRTGKAPSISITVPVSDSNNAPSPQKAADIMKNLSSLLEQMGSSITASITIGDVKGVMAKLPPQNQTNMNFGFTASSDVNILEKNLESDSETGYSRLVQIPKEAVAKAVQRNGSFAGVLLFPGMYQDDPNSFLLNNELVGIEMGAEISNLSHTIDIQYRNVDKNGSIASCISWDGNGEEPVWITDGCQTEETIDSITCQCSHLTFFAILMSPPTGNISTSDLTSLTYITSIGCGLSMFFLAVALFMHCLIRKGKASRGTTTLIHLFIAMFILNLSFLVNQSIANIGDFNSCVVTAAVLHYSMLATFTWFFMQALHLFFHLIKVPAKRKHYIRSICITGWATPAVVVIPLLALQKYGLIAIYTNNGDSEKMCWMSDVAVHQWVNVGYYAVVFIFTFGIFIITVWKISQLKHAAGKVQDDSYTKKNISSICGLFLLLGITWGFAFFSHGPLLLPSYYIFTILNSFQGFFLFIYYYNSTKIVVEDNTLYSSSDIKHGCNIS